MPSAHRSEVLSATGSAPGKVILCGEHSVVYGQPAIAVPVSDLRAQAQITAAAPGTGLRLVAADLGETTTLRDAPAGHPLAAIARLTLAEIGAAAPDAVLTVRSALPIAAGLGSGAAVSVAITRALATFLG
ncbi:MAG: mevalonate kinase, partial [Chloroflexota bacterium]|nr:mevalonate kinase [Chloroflexota bacterium]